MVKFDQTPRRNGYMYLQSNVCSRLLINALVSSMVRTFSICKFIKLITYCDRVFNFLYQTAFSLHASYSTVK